MSTLITPAPTYEVKTTVKKGGSEAIQVGAAGGLAYAATGAIVTAAPAAAPFAPYIIAGLTAVFAAINRCFWNWRKNKDNGK